MKFHPQRIGGAFVIEPEPHVDERGALRRHFCQNEFADHGIRIDVRQGNISENPKRHTLRGLHFQRPPHGEAKLLSCVKGSIYDVLLDLRPTSPSYLQWMSVELSDINRLALFVPQGCANGYLTLEDDTWIHYYHSEFYAPRAEGGVRFDDPFFRFAWPAAPALISAKDRSYPDFSPSSSQ